MDFSNLISRVSVSIGGHEGFEWYCKECGYWKSKTEPPKDTVCNEEFKEYSEELHRKALKDYFGEDVDITLDKYDDPYIEDYLESEYDLYETRICQSKDFERLENKGMEIDSWSSDYLNLWEQMK